ncbi:hypothetical protein V2J09_010265 [Rumex salicifolius]
MAAANQSFFANVLTPLTHKPKPKFGNTFIVVSCKKSDSNDDPRKKENQFAKLAIVTLTAGVLTLSPVQDAYAAKTSGRVGGQAFRSSAPRPSGPRINNSRTNIYVNHPVAPPLVGGYGFGFGSPYYGGWGWSPFSFFMPGPSVAVGVGGGFDLLVLFMVLGAISAVVNKFLGRRSRRDDYDDDY